VHGDGCAYGPYLRVYAECGLIGAYLRDENLNAYIRLPMLNMSILLELPVLVPT
jgi:hypothetical protein